jgi:hypothetical protein
MKISRLVILFVFLLFVFNSHSQDSEIEADSFYSSGRCMDAIQSYQSLIKKEKNDFNKGRLYKKIAECYYLISYIEEYKKAIDSANYYCSNKGKTVSIYDLEYLVDIARYENYYIMPAYTYQKIPSMRELQNKFYSQKSAIKYYKINETIGTLYRNYNGDYNMMIAHYDTAYQHLIEQGYKNTLDEVLFEKARANISLDKITEYNSEFLTDAIDHYDKGISLLMKYYPENRPLLATFYCLKGLAYHMATELTKSKSMFDLAFIEIELCKNGKYQTEDYSSIYTNIVNWSSWTTEGLYEQLKDINLIKTQLKRLKEIETIFIKYASKNKKYQMNLFFDKYHNSPYNSIVSSYYNLYSYYQNEKYIDSALYYSEVGRNRILNLSVSFNQLQQTISNYVDSSHSILSYSDVSNLKNKNLFAIIITNRRKEFIKINQLENIQFPVRLGFDYVSIGDYKVMTNQVYQYCFKPFERLITKGNQLLIIPSGKLSYLSFDGLVTKLDGTISQQSFLFKDYKIVQQPSITLAFANTNANKHNNIVSFTPNYIASNYSNIKFTSDLFNRWSDVSESLTIYPKNRSAKLLLLSAHSITDHNVIDQSYIQLPKQQLSIRDINASNFKVELAVLAMCDAGVGQNLGGSSNYSFCTAFLVSGANSCLYNLWQQDDKTAAELINYFLENLRKGEYKNVALHNAKSKYLKNVKSTEGLDPRYWAGLQLAGNINPLEIEDPNSSDRSQLYWVVTLFGVITVVVFQRLLRKSFKLK